MGRKRIGFFQGNNDSTDEEGGDDWFAKMFAVNKEHVKKFIEANYSPIGYTEQKEFKTSAELIYMLRETIDVSIKVVNEVMNDLEYKMLFVDGIPNWVMFSKDIPYDE